ncbi:transposase [Enterococcus casseliflavus]
MKDVEIIKANAITEHVYMLVRIQPKITNSSLMSYLKERSGTLIN